jgi:cytochrome c oxidase subunit I+III
MLADLTAFLSLVFGYFFFWTIHPDFPPSPAPGPGVLWPAVAVVLMLAAWLATMLGRRLNRGGHTAACAVSLAIAVVAAIGGGAALVAGPWTTGLDPSTHIYPAVVWVLVVWTVLHVAVGAIMLLYCVAGSIAGRLTARHDIDIANVALYWHFAAITGVLTVAVVAGFPLVA